MGYFYFLNFFTIFFELSLMPRVGTKRNDNFYFPSFSAFSNLFWLEIKSKWFFKNFSFFFEFSITRRVGTGRKDNFYFVSFQENISGNPVDTDKHYRNIR